MECAKALKELSDKHELETGIEEHLSVVIKAALEETESLGLFGSIRLDQLCRMERQDRLNVNSRPKLSYEIFTGDVGQWPTFLKNREQLFSFYEGNPGQQRQTQRVNRGRRHETVPIRNT